MRLAPALFAAIALGAASYACSLLVDTSGLDDGPPDAAADASSSSDGAPAGDANLAEDAPSDADAGPRFVCDAQFCDDFDDGPLGAKWTGKTVDPGAALDLSDGFTPPSALRSVVPMNSDSDSYLNEDFPNAPRSFRCDVDLKLSGTPVADEIDALMVVTNVGGSNYLLYLAWFADAWFIAEYSSNLGPDGGHLDNSAALAAPLQTGAWQHVTLASDGSTLTAFVDGVKTGELGSLASYAALDGKLRSVEVGLVYTSKIKSDVTAWYDDVACSFGP